MSRRYSQDHLIAKETSAAQARSYLADLPDGDTPFALIMAGASLTAAGGPELLAQARALHPVAKRVPLGEEPPPVLRKSSFLSERTVVHSGSNDRRCVLGVM